MKHSDSFLRSTAQDYDMTVEQVKLVTAGFETANEFYDSLEQEVKHRATKQQAQKSPSDSHIKTGLPTNKE